MNLTSSKEGKLYHRRIFIELSNFDPQYSEFSRKKNMSAKPPFKTKSETAIPQKIRRGWISKISCQPLQKELIE